MQVIKTSLIYPRWMKNWVALCASESMVNKMRRYEPEKLSVIRSWEDTRPDWPWADKEQRGIFWRTYHRMVDGNTGYVW
ncbi:MAG: hypothetical protein HY051_04045 [Candidatus Aenigmarchaeota archaeon]|nr:hypothetical protein [Candidatus Aenigmarchaeota archaeon]